MHWILKRFSLILLIGSLMALASLSLDPVLAQNFDASDLHQGSPSLIEKPDGVREIDTKAQAETGASIGLIWFISTLLRISAIVAGVWVLFNFGRAAFLLINGEGKADNYSKMSGILSRSVIGIIFIIGSYTFVGLISLILYGDASYVISPTIVDYSAPISP